MADEILDEEWSIMYEESAKVKVLDSDTFKKPVKNIKARKPVVLEIGKTGKDAVELMQQKKVSCVLVVRQGKLAGILTGRDILMKLIGSGKDFDRVRVEEIMTPDPEAFEPDDSIAFVLNAMAVGGYRHVPIVDPDNKPIAVISMRDIVNFIVEHFPEEVLNLPPRPIRRADQIDGG